MYKNLNPMGVMDLDLNEHEAVLKSLPGIKHLPKGLTLAFDMTSLIECAKLNQAHMTKPQTFVIQLESFRDYHDEHMRITPSSIKDFTFIKLSELDKILMSKVREVMLGYIKRNSEKHPQLVDELIEDGTLKVVSDKPLKYFIKYKRVQHFIARYPNVLNDIMKLEEFRHLDAIVYRAYCGDDLINVISIFNDSHVTRHADSEDDSHVMAKVTNYYGWVRLPKSVAHRKYRPLQAPSEGSKPAHKVA